MQCSNNNRASTVLQCFQGAVAEYSVPSRVRADHGGGNVEVASYMLMHPLRGRGRGSFITGRSVHNSRIEHLWCAVFQSCTILSYNIINILEETNAQCVYCSQYCEQLERHTVKWYCKECTGQPALCFTVSEDGSDCFRLWHQRYM